MSRSWDVFCRVVDNFGDAAVCWRLALQLAVEQRAHVRLWIDVVPALQALRPEVKPGVGRQVVAGVEVCEWTPAADLGAPAEIVVEAFGCGLPEGYVTAMAQQDRRPVWIILEYLSAEAWVTKHHGLPSPHPRLPLQRYFFFPGIVPGTGGVLREAALEGRREAFERSPEARNRFWQAFGFASPPASALVVSLFGYENPAVGDFLKIWAESANKVILAVPANRLRAQVCAFLGKEDPGDGNILVRGNLEVRFMPFVAQPVYDELLWACDWNFVRGEDSFVRGQWAERPLVWQIYPQHEGVHRLKLDAFFDRYSGGLEPALKDALRSLWQSWNQSSPVRPAQLAHAWQVVSVRRDALRVHCRDWSARLRLPGDLAGNLAHFCEERLK